jgi:hypothetical protein
MLINFHILINPVLVIHSVVHFLRVHTALPETSQEI